MTYQEAQAIRKGDVLRTDFGEAGAVVAWEDTGLSRIFQLDSGLLVHSAKARLWRRREEPMSAEEYHTRQASSPAGVVVHNRKEAGR